MTRILVVIPARSGSKRVYRKNMRELGGVPLIDWSVNAARNIDEICDVIVSTDDVDIAKRFQDSDVMVPWLRPAELATDSASSVDVALHALDWYEKVHGLVDALMLLQPTSPFRTRATVLRGIDLFLQNQFRSVVAVSPAQDHPMWALKLLNGGLIPFLDRSGLSMRSQDLPEAFMPNGSLYIVSSSDLRVSKSFFGEVSTPLLIDSPLESIDIDTEWDFRLAELMLNSNNLS